MAEPWRVDLERAQSTAPSPSALESVIESMMPGTRVGSVEPLVGGIGAVMHRIDLISTSAELRPIVLSDRQRFWDLVAVVRFPPSPGSMRLVDAHRATGCTDITSEDLDARYVELAEGLLA